MITYKNISAEKVESEGKGKVKYSFDGESLFAEELAIRAYQKEGYNPYWTENAYWWEVMALLFWDVIFAKVKGAVKVLSDGAEIELDTDDERYEQLFKQTVIEMNGMPMDFFSDDFYSRRKLIINNRIKELQNSNILEKLKISFGKNFGNNCRCIEDWNKYSLEKIVEPISKVNQNVVIEICHRLLRNFNSHRSGFPDLVINSTDEFFFAEVKSENDKISDKQAEWHNFLSESLGLKVEMFLINHSEKKIQNIQRKTIEPSIDIKISFGHSSSKKREEAIEFISSQPTFESSGEGKDAIYSATFSTSGIEDLHKMLDFTSGWKSQKIEIDDEPVNSTELRGSLYCYRQKVEQSASRDWCKQSNYHESTQNPFNCKSLSFNEFERNRWNEYGYIDTDAGEWAFSIDKIQEKMNDEIQKLRFCPLFDPTKAHNIIKKLPQRVNPKTDTDWAFFGEDHSRWIWYNNNWITDHYWSDKKFPGFALMIGVEKISKKDRNEIIKSQSDSYSRSGNVITVEIPSSTGKSKSKNSTCFVATSVYENADADQVVELRRFRDAVLIAKFWGRSFVEIYYYVGPVIAKILDKLPFLKIPIRFILDRIVSKVQSFPLKSLPK